MAGRGGVCQGGAGRGRAGLGVSGCHPTHPLTPPIPSLSQRMGIKGCWVCQGVAGRVRAGLGVAGQGWVSPHPSLNPPIPSLSPRTGIKGCWAWQGVTPLRPHSTPPSATEWGSRGAGCGRAWWGVSGWGWGGVRVSPRPPLNLPVPSLSHRTGPKGESGTRGGAPGVSGCGWACQGVSGCGWVSPHPPITSPFPQSRTPRGGGRVLSASGCGERIRVW